MSAPKRDSEWRGTPAPLPGSFEPRPTWCTSCQVHRATTLTPLCPSCLDDDVRATREKKP